MTFDPTPQLPNFHSRNIITATGALSPVLWLSWKDKEEEQRRIYYSILIFPSGSWSYSHHVPLKVLIVPVRLPLCWECSIPAASVSLLSSSTGCAGLVQWSPPAPASRAASQGGHSWMSLPVGEHFEHTSLGSSLSLLCSLHPFCGCILAI